MKILKSYIFILMAGILSLTSCQDYFGDINVDPDNPTSVTPNVLLPQIQVRLAYAYWGDASRFIGLYTQHIDGVTRQFATYHNYDITPTSFDALWGQNLYSGVLMDNRQLAAIAEANGYNHYLAISKALEAYTMMIVTDWWGDAPYSEAFQGTELLQPKFDTQESIYNAIFALISESRSLFSQDNGGFAPGASDRFYGGDVAKWQKFLNVLEARGRLHLADRDPSNYQLALDALNKGGFESSADDARIVFGTNATENDPWYQYIEQRSDIEIGDSYVALMQSLNDPRETVYGVTLVENTAHPILKQNRAAPILTYTEMKFIEAEALLQTGDEEGALAAYLEGIESSFNNAGVSGYDAYVAQPSVVPPGGITLENIIIQKYIALFLDPEVFSDWRRTGFPALDPNSGAEVPRRLPYAQNEILSNKNTPSPATVTIFTHVWWDE